MNISSNMVSNALLQLLSAVQPQPANADNASSADEKGGVQGVGGAGGGSGQQRAVDFGSPAGSVGSSPANSSLISSTQGKAVDGSSTDSTDSPTDLKQLLIEVLQQLLKFLNPSQQGSDDGDNSASGVGSSGGGSGSSAAPSEAMAAPQNLAAQQPASAPSSGASADTGAGTGGGSTPAPAASSVSAAPADSGISAASGASGATGLHLPDALKPFEADIQNAAEKTGMPANVIAGQIWAESRGNLSAATVNGGNGQTDSGLMQVNASTAQDMKNKNPSLFDSGDINSPKNNIMAGALYLKEQNEAFNGNMGAALRAYNSGPNNVNLNDLSDISKTGTGAAPYVDNVTNFANIMATGKGQLPA